MKRMNTTLLEEPVLEAELVDQSDVASPAETPSSV